ncbi:MAG: MFS transporter [Kofleriaceae bacterium]
MVARVAWLALGLLAMANLLGYAARNALMPALPDLARHLGIDDVEFGLLASVFMAGHAVATPIFGWLGDRYDRRRVIAGGLLLASVAGGAGALAPGFAGLAVSRAAVGVGTAAIVPVANSLLGELFDGPRKATALALFNLGLFLGGVTGFGLGDGLGFPTALVVIAAPGLLVAAAIARLRVPPRRAGATPMSLSGLLAAARGLLSLRSFRWLLGSTTAMAFASGAYLAWFVEFLRRDKGMTAGQASGLFAVCILGGLAGVITGGRLADRLRRRRPAGRLWAIVGGMAATVPVATVCIYLPLGPPLYVVAVATMYFVSWYHAPMAASVDDLTAPGGAASAQALVIFVMHLVGTAPASWVVGRAIPGLGFRGAMMIPTAMVALAAVLMIGATRHFAADAAATRAGRSAGSPPEAVL